jgi:hypothetical protein
MPPFAYLASHLVIFWENQFSLPKLKVVEREENKGRTGIRVEAEILPISTYRRDISPCG